MELISKERAQQIASESLLTFGWVESDFGCHTTAAVKNIQVENHLFKFTYDWLLDADKPYLISTDDTMNFAFCEYAPDTLIEVRVRNGGIASKSYSARSIKADTSVLPKGGIAKFVSLSTPTPTYRKPITPLAAKLITEAGKKLKSLEQIRHDREYKYGWVFHQWMEYEIKVAVNLWPQYIILDNQDKQSALRFAAEWAVSGDLSLLTSNSTEPSQLPLFT